MYQMHIICFIEPIVCSVEEVNIANGTGLVDGVVVMESQPVNTVITYHCDTGFVLSGSAQRTCEVVEGSPDGEWSGSLPSCVEHVNSPDSSFSVSVSPSASPTQFPSNAGKGFVCFFEHGTSLLQ